jgi:hypothetical protein
MKGMRCILSFIICLKNFDGVPSGVFHEMCKVLKFSQDMAFGRGKIDPQFP